MNKSKTEALAAYRQQISEFISHVMASMGWTQVQAGSIMGVSHTTVGRALAEKSTISYVSIIALSDRSGLEIPQTLRDAALALTTPPIHRDTSPDVESFILEVLNAPEDHQSELYMRLSKRFGGAK